MPHRESLVVGKLREITKHLEGASACIDQLPEARELDSIRSQLESLRLILNRNRDSILYSIENLKSR
jgi:hypothetical protein